MNLSELTKSQPIIPKNDIIISLTNEEKLSKVDVQYVKQLVGDLNKKDNLYNFEDGINEELKNLKNKLRGNNINDIDIDSKTIIQEVFLKTKNFNMINKGFFNRIPIIKNIINESKNIINKLQLEYSSFTKLMEEVEKKLQDNKKNIIISIQENQLNNEKVLEAYKKTASYLVAYKVFLNQKQSELNDFMNQHKEDKDLLINSEIAKRQTELDYINSRIHFFSEEKVKVLDRLFDLNADLAVKTNILNYIKDFLSHGVEDFYRLIENLIKIEQNRRNLQYNEDLDKTYKDLYKFAREKGLENLIRSEEGQTNFSLGYELLNNYHLKLNETMNKVYDIRAEKQRIKNEEIIKYEALDNEKQELLKPKIIQIDGLNI